MALPVAAFFSPSGEAARLTLALAVLPAQTLASTARPTSNAGTTRRVCSGRVRNRIISLFVGFVVTPEVGGFQCGEIVCQVGHVSANATSPCTSTTASSATSSASRMCCSTSTTAAPSSATRRTAASTASTTVGARPRLSSSMSSTFGCCMSALAVASICCSPPDRLPAASFQRGSTWGNRSSIERALGPPRREPHRGSRPR